MTEPPIGQLTEEWELLHAEFVALTKADPHQSHYDSPEGYAYMAEHDRVFAESQAAWEALKRAWGWS